MSLEKLDDVLSSDGDEWDTYDFSMTDYSFRKMKRQEERQERIQQRKKEREKARKLNQSVLRIHIHKESGEKIREEHDHHGNSIIEVGKTAALPIETPLRRVEPSPQPPPKSPQKSPVSAAPPPKEEPSKKAPPLPPKKPPPEPTQERPQELERKPSPPPSPFSFVEVQEETAALPVASENENVIKDQDLNRLCTSFKEASQKEDQKTQARSICIECHEKSSKDISFIKRIKQMIQRSSRAAKKGEEEAGENLKQKIRTLCQNNLISRVEENFNDRCKPLEFREFVKNVLICESCSAGVPPALMLAIMSAESTGRCAVKNDDNEYSLGLFQINAETNKKGRLPCTQDQLTTLEILKGKGKDDYLQSLLAGGGGKKKPPKPHCLQNPIVNLRESLRIINNKYKRTEGEIPKPKQCGVDEAAINNPDDWRKALAAYNGGEGRIQSIIKVIKEQNKNIPEDMKEEWEKMSQWQKIKAYYFHCDWLQKNKKTKKAEYGKCMNEGDKYSWDISAKNLAYVESMMGSTDPSILPSSFLEWQKRRTDPDEDAKGDKPPWPDLNDNSHCLKKKN